MRRLVLADTGLQGVPHAWLKHGLITEGWRPKAAVPLPPINGRLNRLSGNMKERASTPAGAEKPLRFLLKYARAAAVLHH